jgi:hypothetical protein
VQRMRTDFALLAGTIFNAFLRVHHALC